MEANTTTTTVEDELVELLGELSSVQDSLLEVLTNKRDLMAAGDADGLTAIRPHEETLCDRLKTCHDRRRDLLDRAAQCGLPGESMGQLASAMSAENERGLSKRVKDVSARMRLLQHHSITNWVLAQRSLLHLSQMIEIIATGGRLQPTYGKGESVHSRGALVDRAA